jgi:hypothetical protein
MQKIIYILCLLILVVSFVAESKPRPFAISKKVNTHVRKVQNKRTPLLYKFRSC